MLENNMGNVKAASLVLQRPGRANVLELSEEVESLLEPLGGDAGEV